MGWARLDQPGCMLGSGLHPRFLMLPEPVALPGRSPQQQGASQLAAEAHGRPALTHLRQPQPNRVGQGASSAPSRRPGRSPNPKGELGTPSRTPPLSRGVGRNKESGRAVPGAVFRTQELCHLAGKQALQHGRGRLF